MNTIMYSLGLATYQPPSGHIRSFSEPEEIEDKYEHVPYHKTLIVLEAIKSGYHDIESIVGETGYSRTSVREICMALQHRRQVVVPERDGKTHRLLFFIPGNIKNIPKAQKLSSIAEKAIQALKRKPMTTRQVAEKMKEPRKKIYATMVTLSDRKLIKRGDRTDEGYLWVVV